MSRSSDNSNVADNGQCGELAFILSNEWGLYCNVSCMANDNGWANGALKVKGGILRSFLHHTANSGMTLNEFLTTH